MSRSPIPSPPSPLRLFLLPLLLAAPLAAGPGPAPDTVRQLAVKAAERGSVRVLVELSSGARAEGELSAAGVAVQRAEIASRQEQLLQRLGAQGVRGTTRFATVPYLGLSVDAAALDRLRELPGVVAVHPDRLFAPTLDDSIPLIGADVAASQGFTGQGQTIAILDTGVDRTHPFFAGGRVVSEACFSTTEPADSATSVCPNGQEVQTGTGSGVNCSFNGCEHGTHVAGIAAGNAPPRRGVAPDADLVAIQIFTRVTGDECGDTSPCLLAYESDIILGLERVQSLASSMQIASANLSLGGGEFTSPCNGDPVRPIMDTLRSRGIATSVASGNEQLTDGVSSPGCIPSAITVGSTTKQDLVSAFSNSSPMVDLLAPGGRIESSVPGGLYEILSGTSMAAPHVAGAWAVLKQKSPNASVDSLEAALESTGIPVQDHRNGLVKPRIQLDAALAEVGGGGRPNSPTQLVATLEGLVVELAWRDNSNNEEGFRIDRMTDDGEFELLAEVETNVTTFSDEAVEAGHVYGYRVSAFSGSEVSGFSNTVSVAVEVDCEIPAAPEALVAVPTSATDVSVSWEDVAEGETGYQVELAPGSSEDFATATTLGPESTSADLAGLTPSSQYRLRVAALGEGVCLSPWVETSVWTPSDDSSLPAAPDELLAIVRDETTVLLTWRDNSANELEFVVERRPEGVDPPAEFAAVATLPLDGSTSTPGIEIAGHSPGIEYSYRVRARGVGGSSDPSPEALVRLPSAGSVCTPTDSTACLLGERFEVEVRWRRENAGNVVGGPIAVGDLGNRTASFAFFNPDVVDLIVKVLDGTPVTGHYWVFFASLSDVEYWLTVTDTETGRVASYTNPPGQFCGQQDTEAIPGAQGGSGGGGLPLAAVRLPAIAVPQEGSCIADDETLCLLDGRFQLRVSWADEAGTAGTGPGTPIPNTDDSGYFWFFSPDNTELAIKILDGRPINGHFWLFYGALSNVHYEIEVTDTVDDATRVYLNPQGTACGQADVGAF